MIFVSINFYSKLILNFSAIIMILLTKQSIVSPKIYSPMNSNSLREALRKAKSTDIIRLSRATNYSGSFTLGSSGALRYPITLTGPSSAVITCNSRKGAAIYLKNRKYWNINGITIANCEKGVVLERSSNINIANIKIKNIQDFAIKISKFSSNNSVTNCRIEGAAKNKSRFSQVIAIGSDFRFWVNNNPDKSNSNQILNNMIGSSNGVLIEVKEGSCCNSIGNNNLDGSAITRSNDSWIKIKGNSNRVFKNYGNISPKYGIIVLTNRRVNLGGCNNILQQNSCDLKTKDNCIKILNRDLCNNNIMEDNSDSNDGNNQSEVETE